MQMPASSQTNPLTAEIREKVPPQLQEHFQKRDGAAILVEELPQFYSPKEVMHPSVEQRAWELIGLHYFNQPERQFDAVGVFLALYQHILAAQEQSNERAHKGMPLLWIGECFAKCGYTVLRKRYLMLALCEDAIRGEGVIEPESVGSYFRLVWRLGMADARLQRYAQACYKLATTNSESARYPEWVLQQLDQDWMTEFPTPQESSVYVANGSYIRKLLSELGQSQGKSLEQLAEYVMLCMPGCRTSRRRRSASTDYDVVCSMEGFEVDYRSELGRYFVCECKDWKEPVDFTAMAKFCRVLDSVKSKFGIVFSRKGISGAGNTRDAEREQLKVFQDRGMVIVAIDESDLEEVAAGMNLINILRKKYERVRLDLTDTNS
jgi:hypothetical protein